MYTPLTSKENVSSLISNSLSASRRARRRTPVELFFDEEPIFSDSEDEAEFNRQASAHIAEIRSLGNVSVNEKPLPNNEKPKVLIDTLKDQMSNICCDHCTCCRKIKNILIPWPQLDLLTPTPSCTSYDSCSESSHRYNDAETQQIPIQKVSSSDKINVISCKIFKPPKPLQEMDFDEISDFDNEMLNSLTVNIEHSHNQNILSEGIKNDKVINNENDIESKVRQKMMASLAHNRKRQSSQDITFNITSDGFSPKLNSSPSNVASRLNDKLIDNMRLSSDVLIEDHEYVVKKRKPNRLKTNDENINTENLMGSECDNNIVRQNLKTKKKIGEEKKVRQVKNTLPKKEQVNPDGNVKKGGHNLRRKPSDVSNSKRSEGKNTSVDENVTQLSSSIGFKSSPLLYKPSKGNKTKTKIQNPDISNPKKKITIKKTSLDRGGPKVSNKMKSSAKSMLSSLMNDSNYEPSKGNYFKKIKNQYVDRDLSKMSIDTTYNRSFAKAFARKLARTWDSSFDVGSLNKSCKDFKSLETPKTPKFRKLYRSDEWLNSEEFMKLSFTETDVRKTL